MMFPRALRVEQRLDDDPRYRGSIHDDAVARARGYPAALVPGAFVYGHVSRLAVQAWGEAWIGQGAMAVRFRRPVFNGDRLTVAAGTLEAADGFNRAEVVVRNAAGDTVAEGWVAMPDRAAPEEPEAPAVPEGAAEPVTVAAGEMAVGTPVRGAERVLNEAEVARSRAAFGETEPVYAATGLVHGGCLMRIAMGMTGACFRLPAPMILTAAEARHLAPVRAGERIAMAGRITRTWERKGRHYFESEELLLASGRPAARFRRETLYA
jgi:acyl dehydratase